MVFIAGFMFLFLIIICCRLLSNFFFRAARHLEEKEIKEERYRQFIKDAIIEMKEVVVPPEDVELYTERLFVANRALIEKQKVRNAIEDELGVDMDT